MKIKSVALGLSFALSLISCNVSAATFVRDAGYNSSGHQYIYQCNSGGQVSVFVKGDFITVFGAGTHSTTVHKDTHQSAANSACSDNDKNENISEHSSFTEGSGSSSSCEHLVVDLKNGTLNGLKPSESTDSITAHLPCYTTLQVGGHDNSGGGVYFVNHGFNFYTKLQSFQFYEQFSGITSPDILNKPLSVVYKHFGKPTAKVAGRTYFKTKYGCLAIFTTNIYVYHLNCKDAINLECKYTHLCE